ncbi:hypothetical protein [Herbidospora mongoliensis]|nr:hypothetical protein [Herbidospora mongoliensis]
MEKASPEAIEEPHLMLGMLREPGETTPRDAVTSTVAPQDRA